MKLNKVSNELTTSQKHIENRILNIRGAQVMFDSDLAEIYGVSTSRLNEQVKRNIERFPDDFMFQLTQKEWNNLTSQNVISSITSQNATLKREHGGRRMLSYVFHCIGLK